MSARCWTIDGLAIAGLLAFSSSGCTDEYLVRTDYLAAARDLREHGTPPERIAVLAKVADGSTRYLRYNRLNVPPLQPGQAAVRIRGSDSHAQRIFGSWLFTVGLAHLAGLAAHVGYEVVSLNSCRADPTCYGEDFSLLFTGPILGTFGFGMMIPGIALMATGYGAARDVKPDGAKFTYVGVPEPAPVWP